MKRIPCTLKEIVQFDGNIFVIVRSLKKVCDKEETRFQENFWVDGKKANIKNKGKTVKVYFISRN